MRNGSRGAGVSKLMEPSQDRWAPRDALENVDQRGTCHSDIPSVLAEIAAAARERRGLDSVGKGFGGFARWREEFQLNLRSANY